MAKTKTKSTHQPPPSTPVIATGFEGDEIEKLGDQIASLTKEQAAHLQRYMGDVHGVSIKYCRSKK